MGDDRDLRTRVDALSLKIFNLHLYRKKTYETPYLIVYFMNGNVSRFNKTNVFQFFCACIYFASSFKHSIE